jgi:hypothetical protein
MVIAKGWRKRQIMIKEPEDEAFDDLEKAQQRKWGISLNTVTHPRGAPAPKEGLNPDSLETIELELPEREPLLVDKGCAERGCMGYDSRDGDTPVKMRVFEDDDDIQEYKKPWRDLTEERIREIWLAGKDHGDDWQDVLALARAFEAELKKVNT